MIDEQNNLESPDLSSETVLEDETVETKLSPESSVSEVDLSPETELEEIPSVFDALELESEQGINMQASLEMNSMYASPLILKTFGNVPSGIKKS